MKEKLIDILCYICAMPLMALSFTLYVVETACMKNQTYTDSLFMRRLGLLDDKMLGDFIDWKKAYIAKRTEATCKK